MRYIFNSLKGAAICQIMPHVREDGVIGREDLPAFIQLLEAAFGDPNQVATSEWTMWQIRQNNCEFSLYYAEFLLIAADLDGMVSAWPSAL